MEDAVVRRLAVECHGALLALEPADAELLSVVAPLLPSATLVSTARADASYVWTRECDASGMFTHVVAVRGDTGATTPTLEIARTRDFGEAAARLAEDAEFQVALHARGRLFVHAAAVAWHGRAILVPGRSFSGKSTLAAALVRSGATYLSDEFAILDEQGMVHPFARRLQLRHADGRQAGSVSAEEIGGVTATHPVPVGVVVWTGYRAGGRWRPRTMASGCTALALLDNTVVARLRPAYALDVIARALVGAIGLRGARGDADQTAQRILAFAGALRQPST